MSEEALKKHLSELVSKETVNTASFGEVKMAAPFKGSTSYSLVQDDLFTCC